MLILTDENGEMVLSWWDLMVRSLEEMNSKLAGARDQLGQSARHSRNARDKLAIAEFHARDCQTDLKKSLLNKYQTQKYFSDTPLT
ncbi:MAG: hypothetical protein PHF31_15525 [Methylobacter sp.]|jgi:hypothetical protein|nr:hypothetical protein [Methylobacter sp.]